MPSLSPKAVNLICLVAWLALVAAVTGGMISARRWLVVDLSSPETQAHWDEFRKAMREEAKSPSPVQHAVPKSAEPPLLVLLRDYFGTCLAASLVFMSLLFLVLTVFVRGSLSAHGAPPTGGR